MDLPVITIGEGWGAAIPRPLAQFCIHFPFESRKSMVHATDSGHSYKLLILRQAQALARQAAPRCARVATWRASA